ncbi:MAG: hypothetical protein IJV84_01630 [Bacteroidales bacterium]|nr:hypothetical protein [Bacteroidales bacterium]
MKNIVKIFSFAAALAVAFSCSDLNDYPAFEDSKSFAAFDVTSVSVDENAGTVSIPVTIASIDPKQVALAYNTADGTAKKDVNFKLADESAVLAFDGKTRSMEIVINIVDLAGEYTGDLNFTVSLVKPGNLDLGANSTCTVKINDLDHPLASILGGYTAAGKENWDGDLTWDVVFEKDPADVSVVWISNFVNFGTEVYGNVSEDMSTVTIPLGQSFVYNATYTGKLVGFGPFDGKLYYSPEGSIVLTKTDAGWVQSSTMDEGEEFWGYAYLAFITETDSPYSWFTAYYPGVTFTKK